MVGVCVRGVLFLASVTRLAVLGADAPHLSEGYRKYKIEGDD